MDITNTTHTQSTTHSDRIFGPIMEHDHSELAELTQATFERIGHAAARTYGRAQADINLSIKQAKRELEASENSIAKFLFEDNALATAIVDKEEKNVERLEQEISSLERKYAKVKEETKESIQSIIHTYHETAIQNTLLSSNAIPLIPLNKLILGKIEILPTPTEQNQPAVIDIRSLTRAPFALPMPPSYSFPRLPSPPTMEEMVATLKSAINNNNYWTSAFAQSKGKVRIAKHVQNGGQVASRIVNKEIKFLQDNNLVKAAYNHFSGIL